MERLTDDEKWVCSYDHEEEATVLETDWIRLTFVDANSVCVECNGSVISINGLIAALATQGEKIYA